MTLIRFISLCCLLLFGQMLAASMLHDRGVILAAFSNLPHRSLGMIWSAHLAMPERDDWAADYLGEWMRADRSEFLLEGQTRPVVPEYAIRLATQFPRDGRIYMLRRELLADEYKKRAGEK